MDLAAPAIRKNELDGTYSVSFGSYTIGPVPTLDECQRLSDILLIKQGLGGGLSPSYLKLHRSLEDYQLDATTLEKLKSKSLESVMKDLQQQLQQKSIKRAITTPATATAGAKHLNSESPPSLSDHDANNVTDSGNHNNSIGDGKVARKGKNTGRSTGSLRKKATPAHLVRPVPFHMEAQYERYEDPSQETEQEDEEMPQVSGTVSLENTEIADQEDVDKVENTSKLQKNSTFLFRGVVKEDENSSFAGRATFKTVLSITSNDLLISDQKASRPSSDSISLSVTSISDPCEAALIFDLSSCWRARRMNVEISERLDLNFSITDIESHPMTRKILYADILGPNCAFVEQLSNYLHNLAEKGTLLKILDPNSRKTVLEKYGCGDSLVDNGKAGTVLGSGEKGKQVDNAAGGKKNEVEVINLVTDDEEEEEEQPKAKAPEEVPAAIEKEKEKEKEDQAPARVNNTKKRKSSSESTESDGDKNRVLLTARKSAANAPRKATAAAPAASPLSLADQPKQNGHKNSGGAGVLLANNPISLEMRAFLEANKFLDKTEISEFINKFSSITDINALRRWQLKTLQGVASEGTGKTVGKYIKRALNTPISDG